MLTQHPNDNWRNCSAAVPHWCNTLCSVTAAMRLARTTRQELMRAVLSGGVSEEKGLSSPAPALSPPAYCPLLAGGITAARGTFTKAQQAAGACSYPDVLL